VPPCITQASCDQAQRYSLRQVRDVRQVRAWQPEIELEPCACDRLACESSLSKRGALSKSGLVISNAIKEESNVL